MKILVVTNSRADIGPLTPVVDVLGAELREFYPPKSTTRAGMAIGCAKILKEVCPALDCDLVVLLGDRFETLGVATAAHLMGVPIAHLSGGDITEGSQDDSIRHAITKLSHLHFATNKESADRILQMGEEPWRVHNVGCPGIDHLLKTELYTEEQTKRALLGYSVPYYLVAYQPATMLDDPTSEADRLIKALRILQLPCVFTTLNNDAYGDKIERMFARFCLEGNGVLMEMHPQLFLSAIKHCQVMIGNSSSGLYEAPSLKKAFVNVGDRQKGRICASSVVNTTSGITNIIKAVQKAKILDCSNAVNPYGDGKAVIRIKSVIEANIGDRNRLLLKKWSTPNTAGA